MYLLNRICAERNANGSGNCKRKRSEYRNFDTISNKVNLSGRWPSQLGGSKRCYAVSKTLVHCNHRLIKLRQSQLQLSSGKAKARTTADPSTSFALLRSLRMTASI